MGLLGSGLSAFFDWILLANNYIMKKRSIACLCFLLLFVGAKAQTVNFTSSNLPIIVINTNGQEILNDPKIVADMGIIFNSGNARNNLSDPFNHYNGKIGIEIRGQSSQMFPMKSYSIELRTAQDASDEKSLFGLPKEADWVLYAPYTDKTLMRNFLAYTLTREMGRWASNCRFVELVVNGDYKGVYVFMERIKRGSGRVNIAKMSNTDISGDAVTGGYIFSLDKEPNAWFSKYPTPHSPTYNKRQFSYVYPKPENMVPEQRAYLQSFVDSFENALAGQSFQDPVNGVRKFADLNSFIDYFIVNEVSRNVDGYRLSTYLYKDRNSKNRKIFAGPAWDYDLAFRNADYCSGSNTGGWAYQFNLVCPMDGAGLIPFWWDRLMEDTAYTSVLRCRWKSLRTTTLRNSRVMQLIDSVVNLLSEAQPRHFQRWPILGKYIWPNPQPIATSYQQEIEYLKGWLNTRLQWIDANVPNKGACYDYPSDIKESIIVSVIPNPIRPTGNLHIQSRTNQELEMRLIDNWGRTVSIRKIMLVGGTNIIPLNAQSWKSGVYYLKLFTKNGDEIGRKLLK